MYRSNDIENAGHRCKTGDLISNARQVYKVADNWNVIELLRLPYSVLISSSYNFQYKTISFRG